MLMWLRKYVRQKTGPIPFETAQTWKYNLSFVYSILAWNILGITAYLFINSNMPKNHGSVDYIKLLGVQDAKVVKYSGFTKVEEKDVHFTEEEIKQYHDQGQKDNSPENN